MKKIAFLFATLFVLALSQDAKAQDYQSAIGLRFGYPLSASYKFFISDPGAIEIYAGYRSFGFGYNYFNVGGMFQYHNPISGVDGLSWYYGGGASVLFFSYDFVTDASTTAFSINGALGLDYKFANAPINLSIDWLPSFQISGYGDGFAGDYGALSARYTLK